MKLRPVDNPPNPYESTHRDWLEPPPAARMAYFEDHSRTILSRNDSPDIPFTWSVNPYRGCAHGCAYCYARPYHEFLGLGAGTDFETKIVVKRDAPALLRAAFEDRKWQFETINFSGVTDCYQPIEASLGITRGCLEVCHAFGNPVGIVTRSFLVVRDADLLGRMAKRRDAVVYVSIPFADRESCALLEPAAPPPGRRFEVIRRLSEAGVPVGVMVAPIIPGLTDTQVPEILERAAGAGARAATYCALRLPGSVQQVFPARLEAVMPMRAKRIMTRLYEVRGGKLDESAFGRRMRGEGAYWESVRSLFEVTRRRLGLSDKMPKPRATGGFGGPRLASVSGVTGDARVSGDTGVAGTGGMARDYGGRGSRAARQRTSPGRGPGPDEPGDSKQDHGRQENSDPASDGQMTFPF